MSTPNTPDGFPPYQGSGSPNEPPQPAPESPYSQPPAQQLYGQPQPPSFGEAPSPYGQPAPAPAPPYGQPQPPSFGEASTYPQPPAPPFGQPQPPMGMPYGQPMPPQPMPPVKKSHRGLWITLASIAAALILICALLGLLVVKPLADKGAAIVGAATVAGTFCGDLKVQRFDDAYSQLSPAYQQQIQQTTFTQGAQLHDQIDGPVTACGTPNNNSSTGVSINSANTQVTLTVTITRKQILTGDITLVKNGSTWKIDKIADSLQGTDLGALQAANAFCTALVKSDYQTAYGLLSASQQSQATEAEFEQSIASSLEGGASIQGCTPDLTSYTVTGDTSTLKSSLNIAVSGTTVPVPTTLTLVKENGAWKISNIDIPQQ